MRLTPTSLFALPPSTQAFKEDLEQVSLVMENQLLMYVDLLGGSQKYSSLKYYKFVFARFPQDKALVGAASRIAASSSTSQSHLCLSHNTRTHTHTNKEETQPAFPGCSSTLVNTLTTFSLLSPHGFNFFINSNQHICTQRLGTAMQLTPLT